MALNKLRKLDEDCAGVTLPKDDLRLDGLLDEDGELIEDEQWLHVDRQDEGEWTIEVVEDL